MNNMPELKIGVVAVSRDCFPESLSVNRRKALISSSQKLLKPLKLYGKKIHIKALDFLENSAFFKPLIDPFS